MLKIINKFGKTVSLFLLFCFSISLSISFHTHLDNSSHSDEHCVSKCADVLSYCEQIAKKTDSKSCNHKVHLEVLKEICYSCAYLSYCEQEFIFTYLKEATFAITQEYNEVPFLYSAFSLINISNKSPPSLT